MEVEFNEILRSILPNFSCFYCSYVLQRRIHGEAENGGEADEPSITLFIHQLWE